MHTEKQLEAHKIEKGALSCDSDAPKVGSARSDWTRVVKLNRRKTKRRKTKSYCISLFVNKSVLLLQDKVKTSV